MPEAYTKCRDSYIRRGVPAKEAKSRCAATYFKRTGVTVNEAKKRGYAADLSDDEFSMVSSILGEAGGAKTTTITIEAAHGLAISERVSLGASDRPNFGDDGLITVVAARVGSSAIMRDSQTGSAKVVKWSREALERMAPTWIGGRVSANHEPVDKGKILTSRLDGDDLVQTFSPAPDLLEAMAHAWPNVGVSTEAAVTKMSDDGTTVLDGQGIGITAGFYPMSPLCPPDEGCRILASEVSKGATMVDECDCGKEQSLKAAELKAEEIAAKLKTTQGELAKVKADFESLKVEAADLRTFRSDIEAKRRKDLLATADSLGANVTLNVMAAMPLDALEVVVAQMGEVAKKNEIAVGSGAAPTKPAKPSEEKELRADGALSDEAYIKTLHEEAKVLGRDPEAWVSENMSKRVK